jgi:hypothetical protein
MPAGLLIRVAIDSTSGGWNSPCDHCNFCYVPMGISELSKDYDPGYESYRKAVIKLVPASAPAQVQWPRRLPRAAHFDPDFEHLTYGDGGRRAARIKSVLSNSDESFIVFYAGLRSIHSGKLVYSIIGFYTIDRIVAARMVPRSNWHLNAHTRPNGCTNDDEIVVFARRRQSGRLLEHIPIGEYRHRAYRVTNDLLRDWGDIDVRDGYLQRSAFLPRFLDSERFLDWFRERNPTMIARNNP